MPVNHTRSDPFFHHHEHKKYTLFTEPLPSNPKRTTKIMNMMISWMGCRCYQLSLFAMRTQLSPHPRLQNKVVRHFLSATRGEYHKMVLNNSLNITLHKTTNSLQKNQKIKIMRTENSGKMSSSRKTIPWTVPFFRTDHEADHLTF